MTAPVPIPPVIRRGGPTSGTLGMLAALALVVGYFLPWASLSETVETGIGVPASKVLRSVRSGDGVADVADQLRNGIPLTGREWDHVLDLVEENGELDDVGRRKVAVARIGLEAFPYASAALALLLLLLAVPPHAALRIGFPTGAAILGLIQSRFLATIVLVVAMALASIVLLVSGTLWLAIETFDDEHTAIGTPGRTGIGTVMMIGGSAFALLSSFFGYGPGRLRALIVALVLVAALGGFVAYHTQG